MEQTTKQKLVQAINLLKQGNSLAAVPLLTEVLKKEPDLEQAWYLLGLAIDDKDKKIRAFKRTLKINPEHGKARQRLEELEPPPPPPPAVEPEFEVPDWMEPTSFEVVDEKPFPDAEDRLEMLWGDNSPLETPEESQEPQEPVLPSWAQSESKAMPFETEEPAEDEMPDWYSSQSSSSQSSQPFEDSTEEADWDTAEEEEEEPDLDAAIEKPEWLREMVEEEPQSKKDKKRGKKKKQVELAPKQKRRRRRIVIGIIFLFLCVGLGFAGYTFQEVWMPYAGPALTQAGTVSSMLTEEVPLTNLLTPNAGATPTITQTPVLQPTLPPTWTPEPNGDSSGAAGSEDDAGLSPIPNITSTTAPLAEDALRDMQTIAAQVAEVRGLSAPAEVTGELLPKNSLRAVIASWMLNEEYLQQLEQEQVVYKALGFVRRDYDYVEAALNTRGDNIGGFYLPDDDHIYVVGSDFAGVQKFIYAFEYTRALQDNRYDMSDNGVYPVCTKAAQACLAYDALTTGDAYFTANLWFNDYPPTDGSSEEILSFIPTTLLFPDDALPEYFEKNALFPYQAGGIFVAALYQDGGWGTVNQAYRVLPQTSEQILHPEKYLQREGALSVSQPNLDAVLGDGWELIKRDSLGEWESYLLLTFNDYPNARRSDDEAAVAAYGWGGDQYQVFYNAETDESLLAANWVWESDADADQFYFSLNSYLASRFQFVEYDGPGNGFCWLYEGQITCTYQSGSAVLWLLSDNVEILEQVKNSFSLFD